MEKNDKYRIIISNLDHHGRGIGRINEKVVFVPFSLPNEEVDIKLTKIKKNFLEGEVIDVLSRNDSRIDPICPYFKICGGCDLEHLTYKEQLKFKEEKIKNIINKYVGKHEIDSIIPSPDIYNYRNKVTFQVNDNLGFFGKKSYDFIKVDKCFLANNNINQYIEIINKFDLKNINQVIIRSNLKGEVLIIFELNDLINENKLLNLFNDIDVSIVVHFKNKYKTLKGNNFLIEEIGNLKFIISPSSFFQVNSKQTFNLYNKVLEYCDLSGNEFVLDLYCGTGTIGLFLSRSAKKVIGIEINNDAIIDANKNKKLNNINNCEFISGDVSKIITEKNYNPDVIVVDPPRSGLDNNTVNQLIKFRSRKIVYVSCDPMTLARDLKILSEYYDIKKITPVDMFPNTYHVECVVSLERKTSNSLSIKIIEIAHSKDNVSRKYVQSTNDNHRIETLFVDYINKYIICFSTQIGCNLGCKFCYNGLKNNFKRNLTYEEICDQIENVITKEEIKNDKPVLFSAMGIGEPLLNYDNLIEAFRYLDKKYPNNKFALATTGVNLNYILKLSEDLKDISKFKLTVSLHSAIEEKRRHLMPISKNLHLLVETVKKYQQISGRDVEWNYVLFEGINDSLDDAKKLYELLGKDQYIKINRFNKVEISDLTESSNIETFISELKKYGMQVEYYETNGTDIDGGCGQMISE